MTLDGRPEGLEAGQGGADHLVVASPLRVGEELDEPGEELGDVRPVCVHDWGRV